SSDVLKLRVQLANTQAQLLELRSQEQSLAVQLNNLVGLPLNTTIRLTSDPRVDDSLDTNLDQIVAEATQKRPDITASQARLRAAQSGVAAASAAWFPTIPFNALYLFANSNQRILPNRKQFDGTWPVGIGLSWNIWNWLQPEYQVGQARAPYEQALATAAA